MTFKTIMSSLIVDFPRNPIRQQGNGVPDDSNDRMSRTKPPSVRFSPKSTVHICHEGPRYSAARLASWYSNEEEEAFKLRTRGEIAVLKRIKDEGLDLNQMGEAFPDVSPVGLELHLVSQEFAMKRLMTRRLVRLAVLREQALCDDFTVADEATDKLERIAHSSRKHSEWSVTQAETIGSFQAMGRGAKN